MKTVLTVCMIFMGFSLAFGQEDSIEVGNPSSVMRRLIDQLSIQAETDSDEQFLSVEIDGLVIDETKTKAGYDFYDLFMKIWEAPAGVQNYSMSIVEKPYRLRTTLIEVNVNDNLVYNAVLQPRYDIIQAYAEQAVSRCVTYLNNLEEMERQLQSEDQQGTGIY